MFHNCRPPVPMHSAFFAFKALCETTVLQCGERRVKVNGYEGQRGVLCEGKGMEKWRAKEVDEQVVHLLLFFPVLAWRAAR